MFATSIVMRKAKTLAGALYFRIRGVGTVYEAIQAHALREVEFYEAPDATGVNLSLAATKTASHAAAGEPASNAGDGDTVSSAWNSNVSGGNTAAAWWRAQFATPKLVRSVIIRPVIGYYTQQYALESSNNGTVWTTVQTVTTSGVPSAPQIYLNIQ